MSPRDASSCTATAATAAPTIRLAAPSFGAEELERVRRVLQSGWVAGQGPAGGELEAAIGARVGTRHAVAVSNCTAALHLCLLALGVGPGDEVIVADYTFPATGHAVLFVGAEPVFVDVRPDYFTIDPGRVLEAVTPRTRGVIAVDAFGLCADYDELRDIVEPRGLFLLEDAAAALGSSYRGRPAGQLGAAACFSLHGRKGITCGEGGLVTTDDDRLAAAVRSRAAFGIEPALARQARDQLSVPRVTHLGYNYKLSDIQAAIALAQLDRLDALMARRAEVARRYGELLGGIDGVTLPPSPADRQTSWQSYVLTLGPGLDRDRIAQKLRAGGVQANFGTYASHLLEVYGPRPSCPVSAGLLRRQLAVPMHAQLGEDDVRRVAEAVRQAVAQERQGNER